MGEELTRWIACFRQLEQSGLIERAAAVLFGEFHRCIPTEKADGEFTVEEVIRQYARRWQKPGSIRYSGRALVKIIFVYH